MATNSDGSLAEKEDSDDVTPREISAFPKLEKNGDADNSDDDGAESDQSSICQSPSWEGYSQKKKDKKKKQEAEQRKREKERQQQELRDGAKKRQANRLFKTQPSDNSDSNASRDRPPSSASGRLNSSSGLSFKSAWLTQSTHEAMIPEVWGLNIGSSSSLSAQRLRQQGSMGGTATTASQERQKRASGSKGQASAASASSDKASDKVSYPPTSSRTLALKAMVPAPHSRQGSACTITTLPPKVDETSNNANKSPMYTINNISDQTLNHSTGLSDRGRQNTGPGALGSYVRRTRAQSIERSIKGFMQQAVLSDPSLLKTPNRAKFSNLSSLPQQHQEQQQQQPQQKQQNSRSPSTERRPSSSQDKKSQLQQNVTKTDGFKTEQQPAFMQSVPAQPLLPEQALPTSVETSADAIIEDNDGDSTADYITFVTKPYSPPTLELATPAGSIFTSIKHRISRRSSTSSGSTTNNGRSFKERAMNAIHRQSTMPAVPVAVSQAPPRMPIDGASQTTVSASSSSYTSEGAAHNFQLPPKELRRLPKAARVLGEINQETMLQGNTTRSRPSEGSSTSSYHDDSSMPPSPASTPDTSRPQSAKGLQAAIDEIRIGSPIMFTSSPEDVAASGIFGNSRSKNSPTDGSPSSEARERDVDRPSSKGRVLDNLERPSSRGRLLENVERPGSRACVLEDASQPPQQRNSSGSASSKDAPERSETEDIVFGPPPDLSEGLGILDEAWSQSTVTPDNDAKSFVTTLTNQNSTASLTSQLGNLKEAAILEESQSSFGVHPALINAGAQRAADGEMALPQQQHTAEKLPTKSTLRSGEKRSSQHAKHMSVVNEEPRHADGDLDEQPSHKDGQEQTSPRANVDPREPLRDQTLAPTQAKARSAAPATSMVAASRDVPLPASPNPMTSPALAQGSGRAPGSSSPSAIYLQEARRSAPMISSPLANVTRSAKVGIPAPPMARPGLRTSASFSSVQQGPSGKNVLPLPLPPPPAPGRAESPTSPKFRIAAQESEQPSRPLAKPIAKMLVECCHCKFLHDMPSRVYECMAQPDAVVTDRDLGVSGAITTMVKCPWCSHNMSTQCCAGYAAVVYLQERLH